MLKSFQKFIQESEDLLIPRNLDGRSDLFFRNLQRKLDSCNGIWEGDLDLKEMEIPPWFRIPDNLKVSGWLYLSNTNISKLPKNLQCESLQLKNCKNINELPEYLNVEYTINLSESSIEQFSKNLSCRALILNDCKNIKNLSEGLKIENTISLRNSSIEQLPKNLHCKILYLDECKNLKELPEGLKVYCLYIDGSGLTQEYCERMKQDRKISYIELDA